MPGSIEAELVFYQAPEDGTEPFNYVEEPPEGEPERNYGRDVRSVPIADIRGEESQYTLDQDAFQILHEVPSATTDETFRDDEEIRRVYYPEVERLLLEQLPGAHTVVIFDHTIRISNPQAVRQPVHQVHADQTQQSAAHRVKRHAEHLVNKGRYRIVNVWRPINGVVESSPLGFASARTTADDDFVAIQHRYPTFNGEIMGVRYNPRTEWKFCSRIDSHERILLKCFDTLPGVAARVAHTAFSDPRTRPTTKPRESIEVRALVFG
ncbi:hypothetical protein ASPZODRAFT_89929 [Penicilliopsis zonata CBS 506.65]|uniref:Methyltransferase n=1 Tax=Penicilliopsis zonata CBS 506.65 TaxID=1073090 RepID=A0A1L9SSB0_9EURO|nr:hypothetical protein ASPZODRAFT_89929 [Penicilliopsis zonata CBS 506.65]OJJ50095.1 hypothetical protein ASPZODRAFT_89929 [Penicilliopsis zonata CBS 506.65]